MNGRRPIGAIDTIWLNMDRPNNLMVIDGLILFDEPVDWSWVRAAMQTRLVDRYPVFHQKPVFGRNPWGTPHWEDDAEFSLDRHLHRARLPEPGDDAALQAYVDEHLHVPFARSHPLWEFHLVEGYGGGCALYGRFHHSLADGIALAQVLLDLTDPAPERFPGAGEGHPSVDEQDAAESPTNAWRLPVAAVGSVVSGGRQALGLLPGLARPSTYLRAAGVAQQTGHIAQKLLFGHNPETPIGGEPGIRKHAVWSQALPLEDLKHLGRMSGATLNDVLMCAVAGALGRYLVDHGGAAVDLTTMVPVNVRPPGEPLPRELGNRFALVLFTFPSSIAAPLHRLAETKQRMDEIKHSPERVLTLGLISAIGRSGAELERSLVNFFAGKAIGVTTNVAGPTTPRYVAGTKVTGILGWVPESGRQTLGVCIFTYAGTVRVGFKVDAERVPDSDKLVHAFEQEVEHLTGLARAL